MKCLVIFALCIVIAQAFNVRDREPVPAGGRINLGHPAVNGQFPHMAHLVPGCGGSLIDARWVLTAAHCVDWIEDRPETVTVRLGDVNIKASPVAVRASKFHIHTKYDYPDYDIALVEFDDPIKFTDNIKPIRISNSQDDLYVGELATLSGFGVINDNFEFPDVLQYANLTVISNEECKEYFGDNNIIDSTICVVGSEDPAQGSCEGDSGSGLILRRPDGDILIGVASFGGWEGCEGQNPRGFVRPNFVLDWIRETTGLDL